MGTLDHCFKHNNTKPSRVRVRSALKLDESAQNEQFPAKRRIVDPVFGYSNSVESSSSASSTSSGIEVLSLNSQAQAHYLNGDFKTASQLFEQAVDLRHALLHENSKREASKESVSNASVLKSSYIYQRNDFDEGMSVYEDTEPICVHDHPVAVEATLLFNAGQARLRLANYDAACDLYRRALRVLLPCASSLSESPSSSTGNSSSSSSVQHSMRHESCMAVPKTVHRVVVPILHNAGQLAYRQGKLQEAIVFYEMALNYSRSLNGIDDISVGRTLNCLGVLYYHWSADESERTMSYFQKALVILTQTEGPESAAVATALNNLGRVLVQREDFAAAYKQYERALEIRRNVLGADSIDTAATSFNAAQSLHHQRGDYDRAIGLYKEFLRVAMVKFSNDHRDIAVVLSAIAQIHQERKEYGEALKLYQESLRVGRAALGNYHSEVAMLLNRIGNFYFEREQFDAALEAYNEGLRIERRVLDKAHPNVIVTLTNLGEIYRQQRKYARAVQLYTQAMRLQQTRHGQKSAEVATTLNVIGLIHDQQGQTDLALKYLQEALIMRRTVLGDNHQDVSATLTYLGTIFYRRNIISTALQLFTESLRIRTENLGRDDKDVSFSLYNVGLCHQLQGDYKEAIACYRETLRIEHLVLGENHIDVSLTYFKLGEALKADGDIEYALECFQNALRIENETVGKEDPAVVARTLNEIGNLHMSRGNVSEMMKAFCESARTFRHAGLSMDSVIVSPSLKLYAAGFESAAAAA